MSKLEILLIIIVIFLVLVIAIMTFTIYGMFKISISKSNPEVNSPPAIRNDKLDLSSPWQTDFFNQSIQYAEKVLFGKEFIKEYGQSGFYGNKLLDITNMLNNDTKKSIIIAIKSTCLEPGSCRENERTMRLMAEQEQVPLWFFILREGTKKVVPSMFAQSENIDMKDSKIVPLYNKTG